MSVRNSSGWILGIIFFLITAAVCSCPSYAGTDSSVSDFPKPFVPARYEAAQEAAASSMMTPEIAAFVRSVYDAATDPSMTPEEKLEAVFYYIASRENFPYDLNRIPYYYEEDWPVVYAEDMRTLGASTCHGLAALLGYVAELCDYSDEIYWCCNQYHAWVEIDGRIYDPVFFESTYETLVYGWTYEEGAAHDGLGAGYEDLSAQEGTYMYQKVPCFKLLWYSVH